MSEPKLFATPREHGSLRGLTASDYAIDPGPTAITHGAALSAGETRVR